MFVLKLLLHRLNFHVIETARWTYQRAGYQKAAQLVGCEQSFCHVGVTGHAGVSRMPHDRFDEAFGIAAATENVRARERMLIGRRKHLVIEIMQQADQSPFVNISIVVAVTLRARAHRRLDCQRVLAQAVAPGVLAQQLPSFVSTGHFCFSSERFLKSKASTGDEGEQVWSVRTGSVTSGSGSDRVTDST